MSTISRVSAAKRTATFVAAFAAVITGTALVAPASTATAAPGTETSRSVTATTAAEQATNANGDVTIQSCYGGAVSFSTDEYFEWPAGAWAFTSSSCQDINIKSNRAGQVKVCIENKPCSQWWWAPAGQWKVIANDVPDGTRYYIHSDRWLSGLIAD